MTDPLSPNYISRYTPSQTMSMYPNQYYIRSVVDSVALSSLIAAGLLRYETGTSDSGIQAYQLTASDDLLALIKKATMPISDRQRSLATRAIAFARKNPKLNDAGVKCLDAAEAILAGKATAADFSPGLTGEAFACRFYDCSTEAWVAPHALHALICGNLIDDLEAGLNRIGA